MEVRHCLIRSEDDCLAIKGNKFGYSGNIERLTLDNLVIRKGLAGNGIEIGWEFGVECKRERKEIR